MRPCEKFKVELPKTHRLKHDKELQIDATVFVRSHETKRLGNQFNNLLQFDVFHLVAENVNTQVKCKHLKTAKSTVLE